MKRFLKNVEGLGREMARCSREIKRVEAQILCGHTDLNGLCLALADWSEELRLIRRELDESEKAGGLNPPASCSYVRVALRSPVNSVALPDGPWRNPV